MKFYTEIRNYTPINKQEEIDKQVMLDYILKNPDTVLTRDNAIAHITSSGFILNPSLTKALLVHHNIRGVWSWTGGHADGNPCFLDVAVQEAKEETGVSHILPLSRQIASIDILTATGHEKNNRYINTHLHLSVAYLLLCEEEQPLYIKEDENTGVEWFGMEMFTTEHFDAHDVYLYNKLLKKAQQLCI